MRNYWNMRKSSQFEGFWWRLPLKGFKGINKLGKGMRWASDTPKYIIQP